MNDVREPEPPESVGRYLHAKAADLDAAAPPVVADEALARAEAGSRARRPRWRPLPRAVAGVPRLALALGVTLGLLVGVVGGFIAGRVGRDDGQQVATAGDRDLSQEESGRQGDAVSAPVEDGAGTGTGTFEGGDDAASDIAVGRSEPIAYRPLFRRDAGAVAIRAYVVDQQAIAEQERCPQGEGGEEFFCPPADCFNGQQLVGELSTEAAVSQTWSMAYPADDGAVLVAEGPIGFGQSESDPHQVWSVRVTEVVAEVRLVGPDAAVGDAMAPMEGWAILVRPGSDWAGTIEAVGADGSVLGSIALAENQWFQPPARCNPPVVDDPNGAGTGSSPGAPGQVEPFPVPAPDKGDG